MSDDRCEHFYRQFFEKNATIASLTGAEREELAELVISHLYSREYVEHEPEYRLLDTELGEETFIVATVGGLEKGIRLEVTQLTNYLEERLDYFWDHIEEMGHVEVAESREALYEEQAISARPRL